MSKIPANQFVSWQNTTMQPSSRYWPCSPNLLQLRAWAESEWKMQHLGCANRRPIRGGTAWSSHAYGAAVDLGYRNGPSRNTVELIMAFLIFNQQALGVQAVHDYQLQRYWRAGDTGWRLRSPGAKNDHIHVEVHPGAWDWSTTIPDRLKGVTNTPTQSSSSTAYPGSVTRKGSKAAARVRQIQSRLAELKFPVGPIDGRFGPMTENAVIQFQKARKLKVDGLVGPATWGALFAA